MLYIYGHGGFAKEVKVSLKNKLYDDAIFVVDDDYYTEEYKRWGLIISYSELLQKFKKGVSDDITIAIGNPVVRMNIVNRLLQVESFADSGIFPNLYLRKYRQLDHVYSGIGNIFCTGSTFTTNISIGIFNHFNLNTTVGHDCKIGNYNTFSPGVNISGNVTVGDGCYFGTNSSVREGVSICNNVVVGMGAVVLNDITEPGTYVGVPCKRIK